MAKYALTDQTLSGFTKMQGRNTLKAEWSDDKVNGLRRVKFRWADVLQGVKDTNFANTGTATALLLADTLAVIPVMPGEMAEWVSAVTLVPDTVTGTLVFGDTATAAGWSGTATLANQTQSAVLDPKASCTTGGFNIGAATTNLGAFGKIYTTQDAVCLTFGTALPGGVSALAGSALLSVTEVVMKYTNVFPNLAVTKLLSF
jgi:hypothetical protein